MSKEKNVASRIKKEESSPSSPSDEDYSESEEDLNPNIKPNKARKQKKIQLLIVVDQ